MCGIFGVVARKLSPELLAGAEHSLAHRGPDDSGTKVIPSGFPDGSEIGLVHTRLSIIDLSPLGHQPMHDPQTGNWIVFNGEIYNFRELRRELESKGNVFRSQSDTEVVLAAYRVWGEACLERLRGMFAFALWDAPRRQLILVRDPVGIKPLYYSKSEGAFLFSSEVRTLLQTGLVPRKVDATGLLSFLTFGSVYEPWTIVEDVKALPPGHVLRFDGRSMCVHEYWSPLRSGADVHEDERPKGAGPAQLATKLREAVLSHLVSDVPVGIFLSGGIDSSSLVAVLSQNGVQPDTFSLVFQEEEYDEARYSREVARCFKTVHHEIPVLLDDTLAILPEALRAMDQPTVDGINTYLVSAKARAAGVKVALTGLGADELFAGYSNFRRIPRMERVAEGLKGLPARARRPLAASVARLAGVSDRGRKLMDWADGDHPAVHPYFVLRGLFTKAEQTALFAGDEYAICSRNLQDILRESVEEASALDPVNRVSYFETHWYMRNTLLRDSDFMSMAHGLELRVPFLDRDLVETCFQIAGKQKVAGRLPKSLLLASLGVELPMAVVKRPKRGFTLPFERWLRAEMRPTIEDSLVRSRADGRLNAGAMREVWNRFLRGETSWSRPWSLFVLQGWCEQNL